ncbi:MAG: heme-degrading domain-containing protein [Proteobacteria bacterium]|nr:heme-degrading domain-containing protein [Pseudomonadota bacterium]
MSLESDIALIKRQEELLQFSKFDEADAWALGQSMRALAEKKKLPLVMEIRVAGRPLFYTALPGTTSENPDWVRRKVNTVMRFAAASYRVGLQYRLSGNAFDASRGLNPIDYAPAGGGFPIHIKGTGVVGSVTVSGIPQREDHGFVVEALAAFLNVSLKEIQLPPADD